MIAQRALEDWNRMVQVWHGVDAEVGHVKELHGDTGAAAGPPIENVFTYSVDRRVPCGPETSALSCIRLIVSSRTRAQLRRRSSASTS